MVDPGRETCAAKAGKRQPAASSGPARRASASACYGKGHGSPRRRRCAESQGAALAGPCAAVRAFTLSRSASGPAGGAGALIARSTDEPAQGLKPGRRAPATRPGLRIQSGGFVERDSPAGWERGSRPRRSACRHARHPLVTLGGADGVEQMAARSRGWPETLDVVIRVRPASRTVGTRTACRAVPSSVDGCSAAHAAVPGGSRSIRVVSADQGTCGTPTAERRRASRHEPDPRLALKRADGAGRMAANMIACEASRRAWFQQQLAPLQSASRTAGVDGHLAQGQAGSAAVQPARDEAVDHRCTAATCAALAGARLVDHQLHRRAGPAWWPAP